jgi:hypothetical protein
MHYALKIHTKTQSLFKTLECLRLLCHPTCFGHILDHLQEMFLVQCYFSPCCFVTILLGYVAVSFICVVVMCTSLLSVLFCLQTDSREGHMTTTQIGNLTKLIPYPSSLSDYHNYNIIVSSHILILL